MLINTEQNQNQDLKLVWNWIIEMDRCGVALTCMSAAHII